MAHSIDELFCIIYSNIIPKLTPPHHRFARDKACRKQPFITTGGEPKECKTVIGLKVAMAQMEQCNDFGTRGTCNGVGRWMTMQIVP